jgi:preprotein translocase subunit SecG
MDDISHTQWAIIIIVIISVIIIIFVLFWHFSRSGVGIGPSANPILLGQQVSVPNNGSTLTGAAVLIILIIIVIIVAFIIAWYYDSNNKPVQEPVITPIGGKYGYSVVTPSIQTQIPSIQTQVPYR